MTCAIEHYLTASKESGEQMVAKMTPFIEQLNALNGVTARVVWDSAGRDIARAEIKFDEVTTGVKTGDLVNTLKQGEYAIYFRGYKANEGHYRSRCPQRKRPAAGGGRSPHRRSSE